MTFRQFLTSFIVILGLTIPLSAIAQDTPSLTDITEAWLNSPHGDRRSESFTHWDSDGEVPENCATCHSGPGFLDFVGADGTAAGVVDHPAPVGSPIDCATCHNQAASTLGAITFPSGDLATGLGSSAVCAVCHQGRNSGDNVDSAVAGMDDDVISADLGFLNIHYRAAAATMLGGDVRGGYQYEGKTYAGRFAHVPPFDTCVGCHQPHSLQVTIDQCTACHETDDPRAIRTTPADIDGDGDATEGMAFELVTLHEKLGQAIRSYAEVVVQSAIAYDPHSYPYFFADTNGNGIADAEESAYPNRYQNWTPRLLRAAYNYQFVAKDPGAYSHNPHYSIQLLFDSLENLSTVVDVDMNNLTRP